MQVLQVQASQIHRWPRLLCTEFYCFSPSTHICSIMGNSLWTIGPLNLGPTLQIIMHDILALTGSRLPQYYCPDSVHYGYTKEYGFHFCSVPSCLQVGIPCSFFFSSSPSLAGWLLWYSGKMAASISRHHSQSLQEQTIKEMPAIFPINQWNNMLENFC